MVRIAVGEPIMLMLDNLIAPSPLNGSLLSEQIIEDLLDSRIAVIGLGYVGLPLAVEFGKHYPVIGFDINPARIASLEAGRDATLEISNEELRDLRSCGSRTISPTSLIAMYLSLLCRRLSMSTSAQT